MHYTQRVRAQFQHLKKKKVEIILCTFSFSIGKKQRQEILSPRILCGSKDRGGDNAPSWLYSHSALPCWAGRGPRCLPTVCLSGLTCTGLPSTFQKNQMIFTFSCLGKAGTCSHLHSFQTRPLFLPTQTGKKMNLLFPVHHLIHLTPIPEWHRQIPEVEITW